MCYMALHFCLGTSFSPVIYHENRSWWYLLIFGRYFYWKVFTDIVIITWFFVCFISCLNNSFEGLFLSPLSFVHCCTLIILIKFQLGHGFPTLASGACLEIHNHLCHIVGLLYLNVLERNWVGYRVLYCLLKLLRSSLQLVRKKLQPMLQKSEQVPQIGWVLDFGFIFIFPGTDYRNTLVTK